MSLELNIKEVTPISEHPLTKYPEVVCPNCRKHFYWRMQDKEFCCSCGTTIKVIRLSESIKKVV